MTNKFNKYGFNIADNSTIGATLNETTKGDGKSTIDKAELAALLMLFKDEPVIEFSKHEFTIYLKPDISTIPYSKSAPTPKKLKSPNDIDSYWLELVDVMLGRTDSPNRTTSSITINAYADPKCKEYNSSFLFYINSRYVKDENNKGKKKEVFYINVNCSPTQMLSGHNAFSIKKFNYIADKATFLIEMFTLPFFILGEMLDTHVLKSGTSKLAEDSKSYNNSIMKLQIADYCKRFKSVEERNLYSAILGDVCTANKVRVDNQGVNIPGALHYAVDVEKSETKSNKFGGPIAKTGFLLKFSSSNYPTFSLGFYNKDLVSESQNDKKVLYGYKKSERLQANEDKSVGFTSLSIRLDLSIHTQGLIKLSLELSRVYPGEITKLSDKFLTKDVHNFLLEVLRIDPTLSVIYKYVLEKELMLEQLLRVTSKQWQKAWDILKEKGYHDFVKVLKKRQNLVGNDESFTSITKKYCGSKIDPKRLREEIQAKTIIYKRDKNGNIEYIQDENGESTKDPIILCNGVDLRFPYMVKLQVEKVLRDSFSNLEKEQQLYSTGVAPNDYDIREIQQRAIMAGRKLVRHLSYGDNLEPVPIFV